jgi:hypothetical protein
MKIYKAWADNKSIIVIDETLANSIKQNIQQWG